VRTGISPRRSKARRPLPAAQLEALQLGLQLCGVLLLHITLTRRALSSGAARADAIVGVQEELNPRGVRVRGAGGPLCSS
jgi:hypothetical protein